MPLEDREMIAKLKCIFWIIMVLLVIYPGLLLFNELLNIMAFYWSKLK